MLYLEASIFITSLLILWAAHWVYKWRNPKCNGGKLPPGSMGLPILGETFQFFTPTTTSDIQPFVKDRIKRYGPIFKTSLVGRPVVVSADMELNHFVFQQEEKLFESWYPDSFTEIAGRQNVGSLHGFMFKYLKNMVLKMFGPETLKGKLIHDIEKTTTSSLQSWSSQPTVDLKDAIAAMIFDLSAKKLISYESSSSENLRSNFGAFIKGLISFPINIPGTAYYKCLQGRKNAMRMLKNLLAERRQSPNTEPVDYFDFVIEELKKENTILTEAISLDLMFVLLFASFETTSLALTLGVKLLTDHPTALQQLKEEHNALVTNRHNADSGITWQEYKSMTFTFQVINETLRLANIVPGIFRKALDDVHIKGYTIPAGWVVMACPPAVHLNPDIYEDPLTFNPWRWKDKPEVTNGSKDFMAFGGGIRLCVGADFSKLQMAVFLHCLLTKYDWKPIKGGNILRTPGLQFPDDYHIQLFPTA